MVKLKKMAAFHTELERLHSLVIALSGVKASLTAMVSCAGLVASCSLI